MQISDIEHCITGGDWYDLKGSLKGIRTLFSWQGSGHSVIELKTFSGSMLKGPIRIPTLNVDRDTDV